MKKLLLFFAAVMVAGSMMAETVTATLTGSAMLESESPSTSYADHTSTGITDSDGNVWYGRWTYAKSSTAYYHMIGIKKVESSNSSRIQLPIFQGNIQTITIKATNGSSNNATATSGSNAGFAKTRLAVISGNAYTSAEATTQANQLLIAGDATTPQETYIFDFTELDDNYNGDGLYICSLDGVARIWSLTVEYEETAAVNVTGVSLNKTSEEVLVGETTSLIATVVPTNATNKNITWTSSNIAVATVSNAGVITGVSAGTSTITAKTVDGNFTATCSVTVVAPSLTGNIYKKVTSNQTNWAGKYLIVYESTEGNFAMNGSLSSIDAAGNGIAVQISDGIIATNELTDQAVFTIEAYDGGYYSIKTGTGVYIGVGSYNNGLGTNSKNTNYKNQISYNTTDNCSKIFIKADKNLTDNKDSIVYLNYNKTAGQERFRYYKDGSQENIQLYKLQKEEVTVSTAQYSTYYNADAAFIMPEGLEGIVVDEVDGTNLDFTAYYEEGDVVPAGEPVILHATSTLAEATTFTLEYSTTTEATLKSTGDNLLSGTSTADEFTTGGSKYYRLSQHEGQVGFYWGAANGAAFKPGAHKAYLAVSSTSAPAHFLLEDEVTAVENVETAEAVKFFEDGQILIKKNGVVYNVMGQIVK